MKAKNGFTVIEFLVVVAVLGVLMALLLPALQSARRMTQERAARAAMVAKEIKSPTTLDELMKASEMFWVGGYRCRSFDDKRRVVVFRVMENGQYGDSFEICFDEKSYAFIKAHEQRGLAEIVLLWRAEQDAKNK